jgi:hypothetical protein
MCAKVQLCCWGQCFCKGLQSDRIDGDNILRWYCRLFSVRWGSGVKGRGRQRGEG